MTIHIGLIGCGTVGGGVATLLHEQADWYARRLGTPIELRRVLVRDIGCDRHLPVPRDRFTDDPETFFGDPEIAIVVEAAGGLEPAGSFVRRALESGRHVVTANKALLAARGGELYALARRHNACIAFEASCGGGIPILSALKFGLSANRIDALYGILNGTSNYILTRMAEDGATYTDALADARVHGFAEADPTLDVSGADSAQKLAIIASLAFGVSVSEEEVACEGIEELTLSDIRFAGELGYTVKLLAIGERRGGRLLLRVRPCLLHNETPLAKIRHAFNALSVYGHAVGHTMYYGKGAGRMPTASAVVGDLLNVASGWYPLAFANMRIWPDQHEPMQLLDPDEVTSRYFLRVSGRDTPGVLAKVAQVLGEEGISISAVLQHETDDGAFVPLVITTHNTAEGAVTRAADRLTSLEVVRARPLHMRIVEQPEES